MSSTLSPIRSEFSAGPRDTEPPVDATLRTANPKNVRFPNERPSLGKRASRALTRFMITFCVGVAATLVWQSYGDAAKEAIASSSPQLGWLAPQSASVAQADIIAPAAVGAPSPDLEQLRAVSHDLAVVRQSVDQLAAQFTAAQEQITRDITKLQAAEEDILHKISAPPSRPAEPAVRKPAPLTPPSQAPLVR
jgi:hypothetical protein